MQQISNSAAVWVRGLMAAVLMLLGCAAGYAETPNSDDINDVILVEGSVPVKWTNDATYPWELTETEIQTPLISENDKTSTLMGSYTSTYPTEISFEWYRNYYSGDSEKIELYVDDEFYGSIVYTSSWTTRRFILPAGSHVLRFVNYSGQYASHGYRGALRNLRVWQCKELESACLTAKSLPLTFENDPENMWITEDGYIRSNAGDIKDNTSIVSTTFTVKDRPAKLSFEGRTGGYHEEYNRLSIYIDGEYFSRISGEDWVYDAVVLSPGTHTVEFREWHSYVSTAHWAQIRNIELHQDWIDVTLANAGDLGREILYKVEDLTAVELLKITGPMNDADWNIIKQLNKIKEIDMTGTQIEAIPSSAFEGLSYLSTVLFPETLKTIGDRAFQKTRPYHYHIPASVESIGDRAWYQTSLFAIEFAEGSKLTTIGYGAFYSCENLKEFIMPDSVEELVVWGGGNQFSGCKSLKSLHISNKLTSLPSYFAWECSALEEVELHEGLIAIGEQAFYEAGIKELILPESVTSIENYAFANCKNLENVTLNSHCNTLPSQLFSSCTALKTVVCPVATPPTYRGNQPFYGTDRTKIKVLVPDFALEDYKTNSYWYAFILDTTDEASVRDYWYIGNRLTLDKGKRIRNTPDIDMGAGSSIFIDEDAPQPFKNFTYTTGESSQTSFLSETDAVTAESLTMRFDIDTANKWFFFSPITDVDYDKIYHTTTDAWVIRRYNGERRALQNSASGNWENVTSGKLLRGEGYIVQANAAGYLVLPAAKEEHSNFFGAAESTLDITTHACEDEPANANWNYLGNPYPTCFDIHDMDMEAPITVWTGSTYRALSLSDDRYVLRPMQPFFVQKPEECDALVMLRDGKQLTTTPSSKKAPRRASETGRQLVNLYLYAEQDSIEHDMTRVVINEKARRDYDPARDASKFMSLNAETAQIYTINDAGIRLAINERPYGEGSVRLGLYIPAAGRAYTIEAERLDRNVWIYDTETGIEYDLKEGPCTFIADREGDLGSRFILRFAPEVPVNVEGIEEVMTVIGSVEGGIAVTAAAGTEVAIYSIDGTEAGHHTATGAAVETALTPGAYVVKAGSESMTVIVK